MSKILTPLELLLASAADASSGVPGALVNAPANAPHNALVDQVRSLQMPYGKAAAFVGSLVNAPYVVATQPYKMAGDGYIAVTLVNTAAADRTCQLMLMFLEPGGRPY